MFSLQHVLSLAREVGATEIAGAIIFTPEMLQQMAAQCGKVGRDRTLTAFDRAAKQVINSEREACAKICEFQTVFGGTVSDCRDAIRARGQA